jgi:hypothetical protein
MSPARSSSTTFLYETMQIPVDDSRGGGVEVLLENGESVLAPDHVTELVAGVPELSGTAIAATSSSATTTVTSAPPVIASTTTAAIASVTSASTSSVASSCAPASSSAPVQNASLDLVYYSSWTYS